MEKRTLGQPTLRNPFMLNDNDVIIYNITVFFIWMQHKAVGVASLPEGAAVPSACLGRKLFIFRSSWRISKSYSRCCSSSSSCGLFCFTAYSFHRNFLKLGTYMQKAHAQTVTISDFENSSQKKSYDVKISPLMAIA